MALQSEEIKISKPRTSTTFHIKSPLLHLTEVLLSIILVVISQSSSFVLHSLNRIMFSVY